MNTQLIAPWLFCTLLAAAASAFAQDAGDAQALVRSVSNELLQSIKADGDFRRGNLPRLKELVDRQVLPHVDMQRLTSLSMGRFWKEASPEQRERLQAEFKTLLVRSYAGALSEVSAQQTIDMRPLRASPSDDEVGVSTLVRGAGEPIPIDYRLERKDGQWLIYDVAIAGVWLAANYRNSFAQEVGGAGIDGLIDKLTARNRGFADSAIAR